MPTKATLQNGQDVKPSKGKKTTRSAAPNAPKKAAARKKITPTAPSYPETLFTVEPNPYHEPVAPYLWIDHPQQNETLHAAHYVVRLGVGGAETVEISMDGGPWLHCRSTSGYWWHDWSDASIGAHTLVARMKTFDGAWFRTPERKIFRRS